MNFLENYVSYLESIGIFPANASIGNYVVVAIMAIFFTFVVVLLIGIAFLLSAVILFRITKWLVNKIAGGSFYESSQNRKFLNRNVRRALRQKKLRQGRG